MSIRSRLSISTLFEQVREYDVVLTPDAPLSLALNRRVDSPRLGWFAATPRMFASGEFNPGDERPLFHKVLEGTDLPWKQAAFLVENVLSAWDETGAVDSILNYDEFDNTAEVGCELDAPVVSADGDLTHEETKPVIDVEEY